MMNRLPLGFLLLLALWFTASCNTSKEKPSAPAVPTVSAAASKQEFEALRSQVRNLQRDMFRLNAKVSRFESLPLDPTEKGYGRINTASGYFLIAVRDAKPYLDGYRLSVDVGNPSTARYNGFKLKLSWQAPVPEQKNGEPDEQYSKRVDEWSQSGHEKEFTFTEELQPSSWNPISIVVSPATAEELKQLVVESMETDRILLIKRR